MTNYESFAESAVDDFGGLDNGIFGHMLLTGHSIIGEIPNNVTFKIYIEGGSTSTNLIYARLYHVDGTLIHTFGSVQENTITSSTSGENISFDTSAYNDTLHHNHCFCIESTNSNVKVAMKGTDVSPNGHRVRADTPNWALDNSKDVWFITNYGETSGSGGTPPIDGEGALPIDYITYLKTRVPK